MNIWLIPRNGTNVQMTKTSDYEIINDMITIERSRFKILDSSIRFSRGDFIVAKFEGTTQFAYFGIVESVEEKTFVCNTIMSLANFEIITTRQSGQSFEEHAKLLLDTYIVKDRTKDMSNLIIETASDTPYLYQPKEPPATANLMKYIINGFRKYNIVWEFVKWEAGKLYTRLIRIEDKYAIKNNLTDVYDWEFSNTKVGIGVENMLRIYDKSTTNMEKPVLKGTFYLTTDNEIVSNSADSRIAIPTETKVFIYDKESYSTTDGKKPPTFAEIARSELSGNVYAHEIDCKLLTNSTIFPTDLIRLGLLVNITYDGIVYPSVLSGYEITDPSYIRLKFGHIRSRLSEYMD